MFSLAQHATRRTFRQRPQLVNIAKAAAANYSSGSLSSTIRISSIPAAHTGEITVLTLNRPKARNAISTQLLGELNAVVEQLHAQGDQSTTRALILASESDDAFCAGADLKERLTFTEEESVIQLCTLLSSY
jgi:methylglutaconyl-CoA hydratase